LLTTEGAAFTAWSGPHSTVREVTFVEEPAPFDPRCSIRFPALAPDRAVALMDALEAARCEQLLPMPVQRIAEALGDVGARFTRPGDPLREEALAWLPATAGISPEMARLVVDGMARDWTSDRLERALELDLGRPERLDAFVGPTGARSRVLARSPALHVGSGNVAGVTATSLLRGLLVKGAVLVKPGRGDVVLPTLYHRGLVEDAPELARASAVWYWPGGQSAEALVYRRARAVVLYGGDEVRDRARGSVGSETSLLFHPHRVSVAMVDAATLEAESRRVTKELALAVATFDRRGCVSPHVLYLEETTPGRTRRLIEDLANALEFLDRELPPGPETVAEASARHQVLGTLRIEAASDDAVEVQTGERWGLIVDRRPGFSASPSGRVLRIRPVPSLEAAVAELSEGAPLVQSVALAVASDRRDGLSDALAVAGATRITSLRRLPWPPAWWNHDGRGPLTELVEIVDLEG
jgi:hypothetical protein